MAVVAIVRNVAGTMTVDTFFFSAYAAINCSALCCIVLFRLGKVLDGSDRARGASLAQCTGMVRLTNPSSGILATNDITDVIVRGGRYPVTLS
jgi:hypothetical protein